MLADSPLLTGGETAPSPTAYKTKISPAFAGLSEETVLPRPDRMPPIDFFDNPSVGSLAYGRNISKSEYECQRDARSDPRGTGCVRGAPTQSRRRRKSAVNDTSRQAVYQAAEGIPRMPGQCKWA
jgi:hypothetical protein